WTLPVFCGRLFLGRTNWAISRSSLCNRALPRPEWRSRQEGEGPQNTKAAGGAATEPLGAAAMSEDVAQPTVTSRSVARGIGTTALARLGGVVEIVAQPLYVLMFGLAGYGLYAVLWAAIN